MKQGQTLCWCVWCGTELVAGGYCYCLGIGCLGSLAMSWV